MHTVPLRVRTLISASQSKAKVYYGAIIHTVDLTHLQALPRALLAISSDGLIAWLEPDVHPNSIQEFASNRGWTVGNGDVELIVGAEGEWIMPGFVDTHTVSIASLSLVVIIFLML